MGCCAAISREAKVDLVANASRVPIAGTMEQEDAKGGEAGVCPGAALLEAGSRLAWWT